MRLAALLLVASVVSVTFVRPAAADDSWMGWQTVNDGQANGIDVSFRPLASATCGKPKPFVVIFPRFKNRYTERVTGNLEVVHDDVNGTSTDTIAFALDPNETMAMSSSPVCVDTSKPIKVAIVGLRFPARDAEQKKVADAKAAADKAAADKAAAQKAAAQKQAAEQAAAEEARKKQLAEHHQQVEETTRQRDEQQQRTSQQEIEERERKRVAALEEEQAARERVIEGRKATLSDLRRGEVSFQLPTGYQRVEYPTNADGGLLFGARLELRLFAWWSVRGERGNPLGTGVEFAVAGGYSTVTNALQTMASPLETSFTTGFARARIWRAPLAIGLAGEWNRYTHSAGSGTPNEQSSVFALGPEAAIGYAASRLVAVELGARVGAVGTSLGDLTLGVTSDLYVAAYANVAINYIYGGATATRYVLSSGDVPVAWNAMGVIGIRVPF